MVTSFRGGHLKRHHISSWRYTDFSCARMSDQQLGFIHNELGMAQYISPIKMTLIVCGAVCCVSYVDNAHRNNGNWTRQFWTNGALVTAGCSVCSHSLFGQTPLLATPVVSHHQLQCMMSKPCHPLIYLLKLTIWPATCPPEDPGLWQTPAT